MKLKTKLTLFITCLVTVISCLSVFITTHYMLNNRLEKAISEAVVETRQVKSMLFDFEQKEIGIHQYNRRDEYYKLVDENVDETSYKLIRYNDFYYIEVFEPLKDDLQVLRGRFNISELIEEEAFVYRFLFLSFCLIFIVAFLTSIVFSLKMTKPIESIVKASDQMIEGDYDYPLAVNSSDEIGILADRFKKMRKTIGMNVSELESIALKNKKLFGALTHEIKTPLTSIIGYSELLINQNVNEDVQKKSLMHIYQEGKRLAALSEKLLLLTNRKLDRSIHNLRKIVDESIMLCSIHLEKDIEFSIEGDLLLNIDEDLYKNVLINLISNSIDAITNQGTIKLIMKDTYLIVEDNGIGGLSLDMFEPFIKKEGDSTHQGLGLALVKDIVEIHKDKIRISANATTQVIIDFTTSIQLPNNLEPSAMYDVNKEECI